VRILARYGSSAIVLLGIVVPLVACGDTTAGEGEAAGPIEASGFLEAESVSVVAETGGRVAEVLVEEGQPVTAGQVVIVLDDTLLQASRAQAEAAVAVEQANLDQLRAGASDEELAAAQAALDEAQAALDGAELASGGAWAAAGNPQSVDVQIAAAQTQVDLTTRQVELAQQYLEEARIKLGWLRVDEPRDEQAIEFQEYQVQILEAQLRAAEAQAQGARQKLDLLQQQRERPLTAIAQARVAQSQVPIAEARIELAQAQYDLVANGPLPEEIDITEAQVAMAEAQVALIDAQIAQLTLIAPIDGMVSTRSIHAGETASPGVPLLTLADLSTLKLVLYIPETEIGRVRLGAPVQIAVDAYAGETFDGVVTFLAREAEFTPRNVQTEEDRVSLVFAVHVQIDNPDERLKPGMPADAVIEAAD
jgi:multidrug resistance efflux pump